MGPDPRYGQYGVELGAVPAGTLVDYNTGTDLRTGCYSVCWDVQDDWDRMTLPSEQIFPALVLEHCGQRRVHIIMKDGRAAYLDRDSVVQVIAGQ